MEVTSSELKLQVHPQSLGHPPLPHLGGDVQEQQNTEVTAADGITHHTAALSRELLQENTSLPLGLLLDLSPHLTVCT